MLGTKTKLCNLVPAGLDTRTSSDAYSDGESATKMSNKNRTKIKRRLKKTAVPASSDDEERPMKDELKKTKRKLKVEKTDRSVSPVAKVDGKKKVASSKVNDDPRAKQEKEDRRGHRKMKKNMAGEQPRTMKTRKQRDATGPGILPVFNLGEYSAATVPSPRLDAILKSVERAHKNQRDAERKSQKQTTVTGGKRGGRPDRVDDEVGTRKTLQSDALLVGKTQFVKLKVHVVDADRTSSEHAHIRCVVTVTGMVITPARHSSCLL